MHHVLIVDPSREQRTVARLVEQGYDAYAPRIWKRLKHRGRLVDTARPMFPCYAFVRAPVPFAEVEAVAGVWRFLNLDQRPATLSDAAVEAIRAREDQLQRLFLARRGPVGEFQPGQQILVRVGLYADMLAQVHRLDERGRVHVLLEMMGGARVVPVRHHELIAA
jgi:transcription antitermination factor NusG